MERQMYTYSQLSSDAAANLVVSKYGLPESMHCKYYMLGLHDNYLIEHADDRYILRIYRNDWRSEDQIGFELDLLSFIDSKDALVSTPILTKKGGPSFFIDSPEGKREAVLFNYAEGIAPGAELSIEECFLLGKAVAKVHKITESFTTSCTRPILDIPYLLDESVLAINPFLDTDAQNYLAMLQKRLKDSMPSLVREIGVFGICQGDINPTNFHIDDSQKITLFDFDQCGYGYRSFEIGKFISSIHRRKTKNDMAKAFIDGYQQVRQLTEEELLAIPYFEVIAVIWVMAIHVYNADRIGYKSLEKPYWDQRLAILNKLELLLPDKLDALAGQ
ncbi:MAG: phosphotransferase [Pseudomonadales bacterium]|nr:phosphotransferase [Pseudomonadales bacterium]